jgi:hypothetical protein
MVCAVREREGQVIAHANGTILLESRAELRHTTNSRLARLTIVVLDECEVAPFPHGRLVR